MSSRVWRGELLRWYLRRARHPFKDYVVGHYWAWFAKPRVWITYNAGVISVSLGDYVQQQIFFNDYYERPLIDWLQTHLRAEDVFWDIGANIGAVTLVAARMCARVVAFEPDARARDLLARHVRENALPNVTIVAHGLADVTGRATLHAGPSNNLGMSSLLSRGTNGEAQTTVPVMRADDFARARPDLVPTVLKIDVEGAEALVLRGARDLLASGRLRAIVFEDRVDQGRPASPGILAHLPPSFHVDELGVSVPGVGDGLSNFLATR